MVGSWSLDPHESSWSVVAKTGQGRWSVGRMECGGTQVLAGLCAAEAGAAKRGVGSSFARLLDSWHAKALAGKASVSLVHPDWNRRHRRGLPGFGEMAFH